MALEIRFSDLSRIGHAYIISSPNRENNLSLALETAAAVQCTGGGAVPCGRCRSCRKILGQENRHPDVTVIARLGEPDKRKKEIMVDQVRTLGEDALVLPNEGKRKVYIIDEADRMNVQAQNAALKILEEPPASVLFLLCAENPQALLPTVRSRCADLHSVAEWDGDRTGTGSAPDAGLQKLAGEYIRAVASGDEMKLLSWCTANEGMDSRQALDFCQLTKEQLTEALAGRRSDPGLKPAHALALCRLMDRMILYLGVNTGVKHCFGLLSVLSSEEQLKNGENTIG